MNKVDAEKESKKYKSFIILSILGLIFSVVCIVYFFIHNDNRLYGFVAILIADIYELRRDIKRYREVKKNLI